MGADTGYILGMKSVLLLWFLAATLAAQSASVQGTVVNKSTGEPVAGAHISLIDASGVSEQTFNRVYGAISDHAGHYSITDMKPGGYFIVLQHTGYVDQLRSSGMPALLAVKAGDHIDRKLEMEFEAHVSGRVTDENGDPVPAFIQVRGATGESFGGGGSTDDRGEFRFATPPGKYVLQAQPQQQFGDNGEIRNGQLIGPLRPTYYPSAAARPDAGVVEVGAGQDATGMDIRLVRDMPSSPRFFTVSGAVTGIPEHSSAMVTLSYGDSPTTIRSSRGTNVRPDGTFSLGGLESKYYRLNARVQTGKTKMQSQSVEFHLTADMSNVQLAMQPSEELTGTLEISGGTLPPGKKPTVIFDSAEPFGDQNLSSSEPADNGTFHVAGLFSGKYKLRVESLPENAYVKSILLDGAAVEANAIDLTRGVKIARLKITVSLNGGQISGKVLGHDGEPLVSPLAMLMVWKDPKQTDPDAQQIHDSQYNLKSLRPGKIRVLAIDAMDFVNLRDAGGDEMEKAMMAAAEEIEIKEGDHLVKDLKVADKEKLNVSAK